MRIISVSDTFNSHQKLVLRKERIRIYKDMQIYTYIKKDKMHIEFFLNIVYNLFISNSSTVISIEVVN
jgi:hypothetical protein